MFSQRLAIIEIKWSASGSKTQNTRITVDSRNTNNRLLNFKWLHRINFRRITLWPLVSFLFRHRYFRFNYLSSHEWLERGRVPTKKKKKK